MALAREVKVGKQSFPNISANVARAKEIKQTGSIDYLRCYYGDGRFVLDSGLVMPAGIQIEYRGLIRMYEKLPGYEYFVGKNQILI